MIELSVFEYYALLYLLAGTFVAFCLESIVRWTDQDITMGERISLIVLWPFMALLFIVNFIRGFFS